MESTFSFFAPLDISALEKSVKKDEISLKLHGVISTIAKDFDKDSIDQRMMDYSQLMKSGRIKYEHNKDPRYFVGVPTGIVKMGNKKTVMVGELFAKAGTPQYKTLEEVLGDIENMDAWNKKYPSNPRSFGFSIEGVAVRDKISKKILKGVCTDVVLTKQPKNSQTYLNLIKSFVAGDSINPDEMSGSQAGRKESLEMKKHLSEVFKMDFKSKKEVKDYLLEKGLPEDIAEAHAIEWDESQERKKEYDKNFSKSIEVITEGMESCDGFIKMLEKDDREDDYMRDFRKSIVEDNDGQIDPIPFVKAIANNNIEITKSIKEYFIHLTKNNKMVLEAMQKSLELDKQSREEIANTAITMSTLVNDNEMLRKSIDNIETSVLTEGLDNINTPGNGEDNDVTPDHQFVKGFLTDRILDDKNEDSSHYQRFLASYEVSGFNFEAIPDHVQTEIKKAYSGKKIN